MKTSAILWSAVALAAAALNLAFGTACSDCCVTANRRPAPEHSRPMSPATYEREPNDDHASATNLGNAMSELRTAFAGSCDDGTPDVFRIDWHPRIDGVAITLVARDASRGAPLARFRAPAIRKEADVAQGRAEIRPSFSEDATPMYLEIDCTGFRSPYVGTATASAGFDPSYDR